MTIGDGYYSPLKKIFYLSLVQPLVLPKSSTKVYPAFMLKVNSINTRKKCKTGLKFRDIIR